MPENTHNRNDYHDISSFKIRPPLNQQSYVQRTNFTTAKKYQIQEIQIPLNHTKNYHETTLSGYYDKPKRYHTPYQNKEQSRQLSYTSKGSNATKNSMKMTEMIALQARNLIHNREKFKYDGQNHNRSSSVQCNTKNMKVPRKHNGDKTYDYTNVKKEYTNIKHEQPMQIPSFGVECRTTLSGGYPYDKASSLNKYTLSSYKMQNPSMQHDRLDRNIQTQIDQRIQRLRTSSTSVRHKQRLGNIKALDVDRLENMDKINIKIKNILTTLQKEEDHYKQRFVDSSYKRKFTQTDDKINSHSKYSDKEKSQNKYNRTRLDMEPRNSQAAYCQQQSFARDKRMGRYCENNVSSLYYYEDESAMLKSSQSPLSSTPEKSSYKHSLEKSKQKQMSLQRYSRGSLQIQSNNKQSLQYSRSNDRFAFSQHQRRDYYENQRIAANLLKDIPECETEIVESKAHETISEMNNNWNQEKYHTFDSSQHEFNRKFAGNRKNDIYVNVDRAQNIDISPQKNYRTPQLNHVQTPSNLNRRERDQLKSNIQKEKQINERFNQRLVHNTSHIISTRVQNRDAEYEKVYDLNNNAKRMNDAYFRKEEKEDYTKSNRRGYFQQERTTSNQKFNLPRNMDTRSPNSNQMLLDHHAKPNQNASNNKNSYHQTFNLNKNSFPQHQQSKPKQHGYSDSIKETPRMSQLKLFEKDDSPNVKKDNSPNSKRQNHLVNNAETQLDNKLKQYEKKLQHYQKEMSASKLLESQKHRGNVQPFTMQVDKQKSTSKYQYKQLPISDNFGKAQEQRRENLLSSIKNQRINRQTNRKQDNQKSSRQRQRYSYNTSNKKQNGSIRKNQQSNLDRFQTSFGNTETPKKQSPRPSHRFAKDDHKTLIENLRRQREEVAALSKSKTKQNYSTSMDMSRLSRLQGDVSRSVSQNSRISANTIVKGKNVDEEIVKLQKKMEDYQKMKKQLHIESQNNTQRSNTNKKQVIEQRPFSSIKKQATSPQKEKAVRFDLSPSRQAATYSISKKDESNKARELLKIVTQENSLVKVKKSILKQHRTNEIKSYLDGQIQTESNRSKSIHQRNQSEIQNLKRSTSKENFLPLSTKKIDSPPYSKGQKKIVLGLAQNLVNNLEQNGYNNETNGVSRHDVNTPKLLRNLKNKINDKSIIKKKAEKKGFRSQFINDLHEDNQVLSSAKKPQPDHESNRMDSTLRNCPQNRENLLCILSMLEKQIIQDEKFRNEKKMFNALTKKEKWTELMAEYVRKVPKEKNISLNDIMSIFALAQEQNNPFYSTRGVQFSLGSLVSCYLECKHQWNIFRSHVSSMTYQQLNDCGINSSSLDNQKKGYVEVDDLTRFVNMELNKYYRKRDLWLIWQRLVQFIQRNSSKLNNQNQKMAFAQFAFGIGIKEGRI